MFMVLSGSYPGGGQGVRCTPFSPKRGCNDEFAPPPFFDKLLGIIFSWKIEILAFKARLLYSV